MSIKREQIVVKKAFQITFFIANILGLWPFSFVNHQVKYTYCKAIYSIVVFSIGMCIYLIIGGYVFNGIHDQHSFGSFTLKFMSFVYVASMITFYALIYFGQHKNSKNIEIAYVKCKEIFGETFSSQSDFSNYIIAFVVKTIVFEFVNSILVLKNIALVSLTIDYIVLGVILLIPPITYRLYMNVFYGYTLVLTVLFKEVNEALHNIASEVAIIHLEHNVKNRNKNILMKKFCELSDKVDNLYTLYFRMTDATKLINSIFSVNIMLWSAMVILFLTIQFLFQFIVILELQKQQNEFVHFHNILGYVTILLLAYDYFSTAYACERLVNQVCNEN